MSIRRIRSPRALLAALVVLAALGTVLALPGAAAKPTVFHVADGPFEFPMCGVPTRLTIAGTERNHANGIQNRDVTYAYTNLLTGKTVTSTQRATLKELGVADNPDGTRSFTYAVSGLLLTVRDGHRVIRVDAGRLLATDTFAADGSFLSHAILETPGPAHEDEARFCAAYLQATA